MQRIALKQAAPGMVLAVPVSRENGQVLVGEGVTLSDKLITRIRDAGVGTIVVEGNPLGAEGTVGDLQTIVTGLGPAFRRHADDEFMMTLHNMLKRYFTRRLAEQRAAEDAAIERKTDTEPGAPA